ncbi:hypothetical protein AB0C76_20265 [Kitasatospora sp. NPDC048722]|uniref:hypothetical protein n=1 Tax=Kitasatospora sp. NPDC048722 TaxID=3155639 RepID=UPI0033D05F5D
MSESMPAVHRPASSSREDWTKAPLISTLVNGALLLPATFFRGLAEMATDPCNGPHDCRTTYAQLHFATYSLFAALVLLALQWAAAYLLPKARVAIALAPSAALLVFLLAVLSLNPGA